MTRRLSVEWPDEKPFRERDGQPIRILALSDVLEPTLVDQRNRARLMPVDMILGCGDMDFDDLAFIADAVNAPLVYVRGNHDTADAWKHSAGTCPTPPPGAFLQREGDLAIGGLSWPGIHRQRMSRSEFGAWRQAATLAIRRLGHSEPLIVISHAPPADVGDVPTDAYHRGFRGYEWLLRRLRPPLWLHGHTPLAATREWHVRWGETDVVNVTGAVLIELLAPGTARVEEVDEVGRADSTEMAEAPARGEHAAMEGRPSK